MQLCHSERRRQGAAAAVIYKSSHSGAALPMLPAANRPKFYPVMTKAACLATYLPKAPLVPRS